MQGFLARLRVSIRLKSSFSRGLERSNTPKMMSQFSKLLRLFSIPKRSISSALSLMPAVSIKRTLCPFSSMTSSIVSLVVPLISLTKALSSKSMAFNRELLPALGLPTMLKACPLFLCFCVLEKSNKSLKEAICFSKLKDTSFKKSLEMSSSL